LRLTQRDKKTENDEKGWDQHIIEITVCCKMKSLQLTHKKTRYIHSHSYTHTHKQTNTYTNKHIHTQHL